jgi:hypothetical protein
VLLVDSKPNGGERASMGPQALVKSWNVNKKNRFRFNQGKNNIITRTKL